VSFPAFHLPPGSGFPQERRRLGEGRGADLLLAIPTPPLLAELAAQLRRSREQHLRERPLAEIVELVDGVAGRLLDRSDVLRQRAEQLLRAVGGHSPQMVRLVLDGMAEGWRAASLRRLLARELPDPGVLDGFRPVAGGTIRTRAIPPRLITHVFSGNVPGVAVTSLVRALLVRSASLGKSAAAEPILPALFCQALAEADPGIGSCLAVLHWQGGDEELESVAFGEADAVIAYGGAEAMAAIAARVPPATRLLAYGPHLSLGVVLREATGSAAELRAAALAVATFDQQGCVSPHAFLVEEGGEREAAAWGEALAGELERLRGELPRGAVGAEEAQAIQDVRTEAEFLTADGHHLFASTDDTSWTVVVAPAGRITPSCLNRTVRVHPVGGPAEVAALLAPLGGALQSVGVAGEAGRVEEMAALLGAIGATRVTSFGSLPWPPPEWHHDGRPALTELLRWTDLEGG
jgi:hypothetical protein